MTPEQLDEIEKLRLAATGGKWQHQRWPCQIWEGDGPEDEMCAAIGPLYAKAEQPNREQVYADAKFMEAMSEHTLPLVKALREAWARCEFMEGLVDDYKEAARDWRVAKDTAARQRDEARAEVKRLTKARDYDAKVIPDLMRELEEAKLLLSVKLGTVEAQRQLLADGKVLLRESKAEVERLRSTLRLLWEEAQDKAAIRDATTDAVEAALKEGE